MYQQTNKPMDLQTDMEGKKPEIMPISTPADANQGSPTISISDVNDYSMI